MEVKWPERKNDHLFPSSDEVNNAWNYSSNPTYIFMAWYLAKHRTSSWCGIGTILPLHLPCFVLRLRCPAKKLLCEVVCAQYDAHSFRGHIVSCCLEP